MNCQTRVKNGALMISARLAAILFPVFARARENARRASCGSNLKQIGLGILQYTQDYDEKYPMTATMPTATPKFYGGRDWGTWMVSVHPYVKSTQLYSCPSSRSRATTTYTNAPGGALTFPLPGHYGVNQYVIQDALLQPGSRGHTQQRCGGGEHRRRITADDGCRLRWPHHGWHHVARDQRAAQRKSLRR